MTLVDLIIEGRLVAEAGYVNNPADRGGPTNYGVTAVTLGRARKYPRPATAAQVRALSRTEAGDILRRMYVADPGFLALTDRPLLMTALVDASVNHGPGMATKLLQRAIGTADDGVYGPKTNGAVHAIPERRATLLYFGARLRFFGDITTHNLRDADKDGVPDNTEFINGWIIRTTRLMEQLLG